MKEVILNRRSCESLSMANVNKLNPRVLAIVLLSWRLAIELSLL